MSGELLLAATAELLVLEVDGACIDRLEQCEAPQQRRLPRPGGTYDHLHLAAPDLERHALQHG